VLHDKYLFPVPEADALGSFLTPMLRLDPLKRAKASELIHHNWLDGIVVQGEIDVIRRAEEEERRSSSQALSKEAQSEVDAMKPVGDVSGEDTPQTQLSFSPPKQSGGVPVMQMPPKGKGPEG
jgi:serine/threonine-protein kinase SRPK3